MVVVQYCKNKCYFLFFDFFFFFVFVINFFFLVHQLIDQLINDQFTQSNQWKSIKSI